jgi:hypothetical protein
MEIGGHGSPSRKREATIAVTSRDPVDEMKDVLRETLRANALELVGAATHGEPVISERALDDLARGLLARKVAEPSRVLGHFEPIHSKRHDRDDTREDCPECWEGAARNA